MTKSTAMIISIDYTDYLIEDRKALNSLLKALPSMVKLYGSYEGDEYRYYKTDSTNFNLKPITSKVFENKEAFDTWKLNKDAPPAHENAPRLLVKDEAEAMAPTEDTNEPIDF